jgi:hypothetical protein
VLSKLCREFSRIFWNLFSFSVELLLFINEHQILYLDCSCLNLALGIFLEFLEFFEYFSCFKNIFWCLLELFSQKLISENNNKKRILSYLSGLSPKARPISPPHLHPAQPPTRSRPKQGPSGPSRGFSLVGHGLDATPPLGVRPPHARLRLPL